MGKHTPTPWTLCGHDRGICQCMTISCADHPICTVESGTWGDSYPSIRKGKDGKQEAFLERIDYGEISMETAKANAEFIVRAVNSHEALVAACEAALALFTNNHALSRFDWGKSSLRAEDIRELNELPMHLKAALALAKG